MAVILSERLEITWVARSELALSAVEVRPTTAKREVILRQLLTGLWRKWPKPIKLNLENPISSDERRQGKRLNQANVDSGIPSIEGSDKKDKRQVTNEGAGGMNR